MGQRTLADELLLGCAVPSYRDRHAPGNNVSVRLADGLNRSVLPPSPLLTRTYLHTPVLWRLLGKQFLVLGHRPLQ